MLGGMSLKLAQKKRKLTDRRYFFLHLLVIPGVMFYIVFRYVPMSGLVIAFKNYYGQAGGIRGIWEANWVGFQNFTMFFKSIYFKRVFGNTLIISVQRILFTFPAPILLALMINEIRSTAFKRTVQTITYMPYFLSWVVVAGLIKMLLSPDNGVINAIRQAMGYAPVFYLSKKSAFRTILVVSEIWKNIGYGSIVYLAAISGVDQSQYEAARVDGATRFQQIIHITIPAISGIIAVMLIMTVGRVLEDNFDQIYNLYSPAVYEVADVFETYIYRVGITNGKFSYTTAVGLFRSVVALMLIVVTNTACKKLGSEGLL